MKLTTMPYSINSYTTINHKHSYNWPAFLASNNGYTFSYVLIRIYVTKGHIAINTILFSI